jgi:hypothetical protein
MQVRAAQRLPDAPSGAQRLEALGLSQRGRLPCCPVARRHVHCTSLVTGVTGPGLGSAPAVLCARLRAHVISRAATYVVHRFINAADGRFHHAHKLLKRQVVGYLAGSPVALELKFAARNGFE